MKVKVKMPFYDAQGLHKKGELAEVETAAFNPFTMCEMREAPKAAPVTVEAPKDEGETLAEKAEKKPRKRKTRKE